VRDYAVLKATGARNRELALSLLVQAAALAVVATHDDRLRPLADQVVDLGARDPVTAPESSSSRGRCSSRRAAAVT
jgi:hypothetical protein